MDVVLLDLGNTLLDADDRPRPGARELLTALGTMTGAGGQPLHFGLVSDWELADDPAQRSVLAQQYYEILVSAGLDTFFQPFAQRVTLSTEVGVYKPDARIFRAALAKCGTGFDFRDALFITENAAHIEAARRLGMMAVQVPETGNSIGDVQRLEDLIPIVTRLAKYAPCCKKHGDAVGKRVSVATPSRHRDPATAALVTAVSPDRIRHRITTLSAFDTRWTMSGRMAAVTEWVSEQFANIGYPAASIRYQPFSMPGGAGPQRNVLCGAGGDSDGMVLLCAHYDSLSEKPATRAPGADDNASGVAVLLETAHVLRSTPLKRGVLYAAFGGEEQGLFGSEQCAAIAAAEGWKIDVVINLDMIAYQSASKPRHVVVEYDQGNRHPGNDAAARAFALQIAQLAADHTELIIEHSDIWNSDYLPFEERGYACVGLYEASQNPGYHTTRDVLSSLDAQHVAEIAKLVVASVYEIAR